MDILNWTFKKLQSNRNSPTSVYWKPLRYTGIHFEELPLLTLAANAKTELVELVLQALPEEYTRLHPDFVRLLIKTTLYKGGFLLTPLEAFEVLQEADSIFADYKVLSTYLSSVSIKERILRALQTLWEKYNLCTSSSIIDTSMNYENYITRNIMEYNFHTNTNSVLVERLQTGNYLHPRIFAVELLQGRFNAYLERNFSRDLISQLLVTDAELFLRGVLALPDNSGNKHKLSYPCTALEANAGLILYTKEVTFAYYEPLLFTRFDKTSKTKEDMNLRYLDEADIYSKLVRISNIRRRSVSQDSRYLIMGALKEAFQRMKNQYTALYLD
jgi:hypothetical protein